MKYKESEIKAAYNRYIIENGYKTNVVGNRYMYDIVKLMLEREEYRGRKMLMKAYGEVGKKNGIGASGIDRALRTLIKGQKRTAGDEAHKIAMYVEDSICKA